MAPCRVGLDAGVLRPPWGDQVSVGVISLRASASYTVVVLLGLLAGVPGGEF